MKRFSAICVLGLLLVITAIRAQLNPPPGPVGPPPAVLPPAPPPPQFAPPAEPQPQRSDDLNSLFNRLEDVRAKKAELEKIEKDTISKILSAIKKVHERAEELGLDVKGAEIELMRGREKGQPPVLGIPAPVPVQGLKHPSK